jgi:hypothetical protein
MKESSVIRTGYSASLTEKNVSNLIPDLELALISFLVNAYLDLMDL